MFVVWDNFGVIEKVLFNILLFDNGSLFSFGFGVDSFGYV